MYITLRLIGNAFAEINSTNFRVFMAQYETSHLSLPSSRSTALGQLGMSSGLGKVKKAQDCSQMILFYTYHSRLVKSMV